LASSVYGYPYGGGYALTLSFNQRRRKEHAQNKLYPLFPAQVTFIKNCGVLLLNGMLTPVRGLGFLVYHRLEDGPISQNEQPTETLLFVAKHRVSIGFHHVMWSAVSSEKDEVITA
jgi:hypothetical protein